MQFIPINRPLIIGNEKKYLLDCINSGYISSVGKYVKKFEDKFAKYIGKKYAVSVSNGTTALQIAMDALELKKNSEVIMPAFTIISCIYPVIRNKLKPILVDSDIKNWNLDMDLLKKKITPKNQSDKEQFYCVSCKTNVRKDRADKNIYIKQAKNGRWMMRSECGSCNTNLTRFISNADAESWAGTRK